jgi:hypothetical protein|tara:strand:+ start:148 stop:441 length:294 start_codon:yes stop_codon:yes gene_type:complete
MKCNLCEGEIEQRKDHNGRVFWSEGNNAAPYNGRCCDACDCLVVIPTRLGITDFQQAIGIGLSLLRERNIRYRLVEENETVTPEMVMEALVNRGEEE